VKVGTSSSDAQNCLRARCCDSVEPRISFYRSGERLQIGDAVIKDLKENLKENNVLEKNGHLGGPK
jgi:hypothetical protein